MAPALHGMSVEEYGYNPSHECKMSSSANPQAEANTTVQKIESSFRCTNDWHPFLLS